jgi:hypothetical protein
MVIQPTDIDAEVFVVPDTGVSIVGNGVDVITDGFEVDSLNIASLTKLASNVYGVGGYVKAFSPVPPSFFVDNVVTPTPNEVNGLLGIDKDGTLASSIDISIENSITQNGSSALKVTCNTTLTTSNQAITRLEFTGLDVAETYTVTAYFRVDTGDDMNPTLGLQSVYGWDADDTQFLITDPETYTQYTFTGSPSSTTAYFTVRATTAMTTGEIFYLDNVTITHN